MGMGIYYSTSTLLGRFFWVKKYRIKKVTDFVDEHYVLETRFLGFLWWYNPLNIDSINTGIFTSIADAKAAYKRLTFPPKIEIVERLE